MKLLIYSDLHVEFAPFVPDPVVLAQVDVVILAGDIHQGSQVASWARRTFEDKPVILVSGPGGHPNCPTYGHPNCSTLAAVI